MSHLSVRLLNYTPKPIETVYTAARTCYSENSPSDIWSKRTTEFEMIKLLDKTITSGHHSILEHILFTFSVEGLSRSASHQLVRHRVASFSQQSQRYTDMSEAEFITPPTVKFNRQALSIFNRITEETRQAYAELRELGIPAEDARFIMPNASTTNIVMSMNFREIWYVSGIRLCRRAQWEIRDLFLRIKSELHSVPELTGLAEYLGPRCETLGYCPEFKSCGYYPTKKDEQGE